MKKAKVKPMVHGYDLKRSLTEIEKINAKIRKLKAKKRRHRKVLFGYLASHLEPVKQNNDE